MHFKFCLLLYTNLLFVHYSNAFNITTILNRHPSFTIFNRYLSETNVSSEINSRETITVLAVSNDDVWRLSGKQDEMLDNLMRVHVVLDYYDVEKLRNLQNGTTQMTTLFQTTGRALGQQGFLKATVSKTGNVVIGSATRGVPVGAILVKSVAAEPFNISVLHISTEIVPVGMNFPVVSDSNSISPVDSPAPSPEISQPPVYSPPCRRHKVAPSHARSSTPSPNTHGESPPEGAPPGAPSGGSADAPASAESPPSLAPKLVPLPSKSRSPTPSSNPPPTIEPPPNPTPSPNPPPTVGPPPNPPPIVKSPPKGAPSANAPTSTKSPPRGAPVGGFANAPTVAKSPPEGAPIGTPSKGSEGDFVVITPTKSPLEGATPTSAPSDSSPDTPKSPLESIDTTLRSPPKLGDTLPEPPPKPADSQQSGSGTSYSSLLVVITIVLSCTNLII